MEPQFIEMNRRWEDERRRRSIKMLLWIVFIIVIIVLIFMFMMCLSGYFFRNYNNTSPANPNTPAPNPIDDLPVINRITKVSPPVSTPEQVDGYNYILASDFGLNIVGPIENIELNGDTSKETCISICDTTPECKGVHYSNKTCYLLEDIPSISAKGNDQGYIYLREEYKPKVLDKVFIGTCKAKINNTDWWKMNTHYSNGNINVFNVDVTKTWFLSETNYDVINYGKLIGIYSSKILSRADMKNLLDKDICPVGTICFIDRPISETYQLNLDMFGRKSVYITYLP